MSCRCGAGCARRRDWAGRVGGDEDPSPRLQAYGKARLPDEVSRTGAGCTAGRGHAQATPLGDDPHHAPTRANTGSPQSQHGPTGSGAVGGLRGGMASSTISRRCIAAAAVSVRKSVPRTRDEDPPGTRRTSQALSAANARERTRVWPAHPGSWRPTMLAARPVAGEWSVVCSAHTVLNLVGGRGWIPQPQMPPVGSLIGHPPQRGCVQPRPHRSSRSAAWYSNRFLAGLDPPAACFGKYAVSASPPNVLFHA